jgi:hypothetical protein
MGTCVFVCMHVYVCNAAPVPQVPRLRDGCLWYECVYVCMYVCNTAPVPQVKSAAVFGTHGYVFVCMYVCMYGHHVAAHV